MARSPLSISLSIRNDSFVEGTRVNPYFESEHFRSEMQRQAERPGAIPVWTALPASFIKTNLPSRRGGASFVCCDRASVNKQEQARAAL
jgi:hypothetical protein